MIVNHVNHVEVCLIFLFLLFFFYQNEIFFLQAASSAQWYQWNVSQPNARLCGECWAYYKKLGGLKYPKKSSKNE